MKELIKLGKIMDFIFAVSFIAAGYALVYGYILMVIALLGVDIVMFFFYLGFYSELRVEHLLAQRKQKRNMQPRTSINFQY